MGSCNLVHACLHRLAARAQCQSNVPIRTRTPQRYTRMPFTGLCHGMRAPIVGQDVEPKGLARMRMPAQGGATYRSHGKPRYLAGSLSAASRAGPAAASATAACTASTHMYEKHQHPKQLLDVLCHAMPSGKTKKGSTAVLPCPTCLTACTRPARISPCHHVAHQKLFVLCAPGQPHAHASLTDRLRATHAHVAGHAPAPPPAPHGRPCK